MYTCIFIYQVLYVRMYVCMYVCVLCTDCCVRMQWLLWPMRMRSISCGSFPASLTSIGEQSGDGERE